MIIGDYALLEALAHLQGHSLWLAATQVKEEKHIDFQLYQKVFEILVYSF